MVLVANVQFTAEAAQAPLAAIQIRPLINIGEALADISAVFLSDSRIGVLARTGRPRTGTSVIIVLKWTGSQFIPDASVSKANEGDRIIAASEDRLIITSMLHRYLYSSDLSEKAEIPLSHLADMFPRAEIAGGTDQSGWRAFRLGSFLTPVGGGAGELASVSSDLLVFRLGNQLITRTTSGQELGSIPVPESTRGTHVAEIAGRERLLLNISGDERTVNFSGGEARRLRVPPGWGFRHGWSADGGRLLFDHYTRAAPASQGIVERFLDLLGHGLGAPEEPNGESISVIDVQKGGVCFSRSSSGGLFGQVGGYHADLSPSGRQVLVSSLSEVAVYSLPAQCSSAR